MKMPWEIQRLNPFERRRFLKWMGSALAAPMITDRLRFACNEIAGGVAYANTQAADSDSIFIEINYRDQWDHGHFFVSPGLATEQELLRGERGKRCALFFESNQLQHHRVGEGTGTPTDVYLTPQSLALAPHLENIAMMDLGELTFGRVHGHEACNPLRCPGRVRDRQDGYLPLWAGDRNPRQRPGGGNEYFYGRVPTPASWHNRIQRLRDPTLLNGFAFKGIGRDMHTVYHFGAGLTLAELARLQSPESVATYGGGDSAQPPILDSPAAAEAFAAVLRQVDHRFLSARKVQPSVLDVHTTEVSAVQGMLHRSRDASRLSLSLTGEERAYWSADVPDQRSHRPIAQIWEQVGWAYKAVASGRIRTVALEFDYLDVHGRRSEDQMRVMAAQTVLPLVRLIELLKANGLWERTTIAIYTLDGGRAPNAYSNGDRGKNTIILAGGRVRGGYFGDIRLETPGDNQRFSYHRPNRDGLPITDGVVDNSQRVEAAPIYRTVLRAAGVSNQTLDTFEDLQNSRSLDYMLRN